MELRGAKPRIRLVCAPRLKVLQTTTCPPLQSEQWRRNCKLVATRLAEGWPHHLSELRLRTADCRTRVIFLTIYEGRDFLDAETYEVRCAQRRQRPAKGGKGNIALNAQLSETPGPVPLGTDLSKRAPI
jgi:hypothetical protein